MAWVLDLLRVVSRIEGQCISEATVKKTILRVISENFHMPTTQLLVNKDLSLLGHNHL